MADMKRAIFATLKHCTSTDSHPQHSGCPDGENSWCFYKKAIANDQTIPSHKDKMTTYLAESVVHQIMPTYQRLSSTELLEKCQVDTQNSYESLHSVIWNELPKTKFFCLRQRQMRYGIYHAVMKFNHGLLAVEKATGELCLGEKKIMDMLDIKISDVVRKESSKEEPRQEK